MQLGLLLGRRSPCRTLSPVYPIDPRIIAGYTTLSRAYCDGADRHSLCPLSVMRWPDPDKGREPWYLILFLVLFLIGTGLLAWYEITRPDAGGALSITSRMIHGMSQVVVVAGALTYVTVEGWRMLAERYERRRYQAGLREGRAEERKEWLEWFDQLPDHVKREIKPPPTGNHSDERS